jgi:hypothetical protein
MRSHSVRAADGDLEDMLSLVERSGDRGAGAWVRANFATLDSADRGAGEAASSGTQGLARESERLPSLLKRDPTRIAAYHLQSHVTYAARPK